MFLCVWLQQHKLILTAKLLKQGYRYHKNRREFSTFYHRHSKLIILIQHGVFNSSTTRHIRTFILYINSNKFFENLILVINSKILSNFIKVGYNLDVMRQSASLVLIPITTRWCLTVSCNFPIGILGQVWYLIVSTPDLCTLTYFYSYGFLFKCTTVGQASDSMTALT